MKNSILRFISKSHTTLWTKIKGLKLRPFTKNYEPSTSKMEKLLMKAAINLEWL
jgi:hypothetical protein